MSHEIETNEDGSAAFYSHRQPAWHDLGVVTDEAADAPTALALAGMDWPVEKSEAEVTVDLGGVAVPVAGKHATFRTLPSGAQEPLGIVGTGYHPIQNAEAFEWLSAVALETEGQARFETAGSLRGGRQVFVSMRMPQRLSIGGRDPIDEYLIAFNSHDGSTGLGMLISPVRVVCQNTLGMAIGGAKHRVSIRHTSGAQAALDVAREELGIYERYMATFAESAERLLATSMTDAQFVKWMNDHLFATPTTERQKASRQAKTDEYLGYFNGETNAEIAGTRWAALQAITEASEWGSTARTDSHHSENALLDGTAPALVLRQKAAAKLLAGAVKI